MNCPHCGHEIPQNLGTEKVIQKGLIYSDSESSPEEESENTNPPFSGGWQRPTRGKAREYSAHFETAWKAYGRKEEKLRAFLAWQKVARTVGGEARLLPLILRAFTWQVPMYATNGWTYAKYFERYLNARKWEDEPPPAPVAAPRPVVRMTPTPGVPVAITEATQRFAGKPMPAEELAALKALRSGVAK